MSAAFIITPEGKSLVIRPAKGDKFSLRELQEAVGGYIEIVPTKSGRLMVLNADGKREPLPRNHVATFLAELVVPGDYIAGQVVIVDRGQVE